VCTASAATFVVTKTADTNDGTCDSDCSLREAIAAANATPAESDVTAFSSLFDSPQTIVLSGSEMVITVGGITINGPGANLLTLDGNQASRILTVGPGAVANINGIRFTRGTGAGALNTGRGGAFYVAGGTAVISSSVFTMNTAANGGAFNNASGGTPSTPADTTYINCTFSNNTSSSSGGAGQNFGGSTLRIINSTFSGNTSTTSGGGALQANGIVHIVNSTFSGNAANGGSGGGAIWSNGNPFIMTNSTLTGNTSTLLGGGLSRATTNVNGFLRNNIISGNTGPSPDVSNSTGGIQSQGNNIIGNVGTSTGWVASDFQNVNPMLGPLADNGGFSFTHLPQAGSPAINAGQNCVVDASCPANNPFVPVATDQRGIARPQGGTVDIGSVEVAAVTNVTVSGRVLSSVSYVPRAIVRISNTSGIIASDVTNSFGNFTLTGVPSGQTYTVTVFAKGYTFAPVNLPVTGDVTNLEITATGTPFTRLQKKQILNQ
jgi:CSLREA domain-containing protein